MHKRTTFDGLGDTVKFIVKLNYSDRLGDSVIIFDVKIKFLDGLSESVTFDVQLWFSNGLEETAKFDVN